MLGNLGNPRFLGNLEVFPIRNAIGPQFPQGGETDIIAGLRVAFYRPEILQPPVSLLDGGNAEMHLIRHIANGGNPLPFDEYPFSDKLFDAGNDLLILAFLRWAIQNIAPSPPRTTGDPGRSISSAVVVKPFSQLITVRSMHEKSSAKFRRTDIRVSNRELYSSLFRKLHLCRAVAMNYSLFVQF